MTRSDDRRSALVDGLVDRLADHVLAHGLSASSLRPLAKAAGTSDRMLLYYFKDKGEVIGAVLDRVAERMVVLMMARGAGKPLPLEALTEELQAILYADDLWPFMCLWLEIASLSARGDPLFRAVGEKIGRGFLAWGEAQLESPNDASRRTDAAKLLVRIEGMLVLRSIGMADAARDSL